MLQPETYYHIYNCANGSENLFRGDENYHFFLRQWGKYIEPIANTYAYCLLGNHFHFLVRIRPEKQLILTFGKFESETSYPQTSKVFENLGGLNRRISQQFSNLFNSYTKAYNKMYDRRGSLFSPNFKAKEVGNDNYFTNLIHYIHHNPVHHGFTDSIEGWPHSSYHALCSTKPTKVKREDVFDWFGGPSLFREFHSNAFKHLNEFEENFT